MRAGITATAVAAIVLVAACTNEPSMIRDPNVLLLTERQVGGGWVQAERQADSKDGVGEVCGEAAIYARDVRQSARSTFEQGTSALLAQGVALFASREAADERFANLRTRIANCRGWTVAEPSGPTVRWTLTSLHAPDPLASRSIAFEMETEGNVVGLNAVVPTVVTAIIVKIDNAIVSIAHSDRVRTVSSSAARRFVFTLGELVDDAA